MSLEGQESPRKRRRSPTRLIIIVGGILVLEAVVIIGAMTLLGGPPEVEAAEAPAVLDTPEEERISRSWSLTASCRTTSPA